MTTTNPNQVTPFISPAQREQFVRDGYVVVSGVIPDEAVTTARDVLWNVIGANPDDSSTWDPEGYTKARYCHQEMAICRTEELEQAAAELVGPHFLPGLGYSPVLELKGEDALFGGYIPVLNYPKPGPQEWVPPTGGFHIDGMHGTTLWPEKLFLIMLAYLSDTAVHGGATCVYPGSHRQVFQHWIERGESPVGSGPLLPDIAFNDPVPIPGKAGDVILMHYLLVHAGSANHSEQIRFALNTGVHPSLDHPYRPRLGPPGPDWTPLDYTLRTDNINSVLS